MNAKNAHLQLSASRKKAVEIEVKPGDGLSIPFFRRVVYGFKYSDDS
jgi:hypothetical protein